MAKKNEKSSAEYIVPLAIDGLNGRMLRLPAPKNKKREILLIYGHHASIERMESLARELNKYGSITLPDLPGFGGMDTFYKMGEKPTLDNMADYLAAFVKMRYSRRRVTIVAISYGFLVATRMLQKYPELAKKVDLLVSIVGFTHHEDFKFSPGLMRLMRFNSWLFSRRLPAWLAKTFVLHGPIIAGTYNLVSSRHVKMKDANPEERKRRIKFEIVLWKINDFRTYAATMNGMLKANVCDKQVDVPVCHVAVDGDQYFDLHRTEQHMRVIFDDFQLIKASMKAHMPTIVASPKEVAPLIPPKLRRILTKQP